MIDDKTVKEVEEVLHLRAELDAAKAELACYKECCQNKEPMPCHVCGKLVLRNRGRMHNRKVTCDSPKCKQIQKLGHDRPANFKNVPNLPGPTHADRDYYGGYHE
jgi:hypothetical protein